MDVFSLLKSIGIPGSVAAGGVLIYLFVVTFRPITLLSANAFEKKLFSKEKLFLLMSWQHFWQTMLWMCVFLSFTISLNVQKWAINQKLSSTVGSIAIVVGELIFFLILAVKDSKKENSKWNILKSKPMKIVLSILFILCLGVFYISFDGFIVGSALQEKGWNKFILLLIFPFFISLPIPFLMKPISRFIEWSKEMNIYIISVNEDRQQEEVTQDVQNDVPTDVDDKKRVHWYILHPINKEFILLGNNANRKLCTETKIIKFEELCDTTMFIEEKK
ncbi:hypothetical protein P4T89_03570 [Bacillus nakamurai]|uniref:Uncharacterized protein n=1 Tax=Bacillus nakamurai TaxID=1793963 RepID=A0A150F9M2_9BACI|nr:hypothetical protein [Bacillus nakamurai]KXZ21822.1 hypothetical protein AXI58_12850 [Bacillus nakamurai]MED1226708.1 hypothetical protein [Bacillus nakamurai]